MIAFARRHSLALTLVGGALFVASCGLTASHVLAIRNMRDDGFRVAAAVQPLQRRKAVLREQADIAKLQASARGETYRELYDLYVLPQQPDLPRVLASLETLLTHLRRQGVVRSIEKMEIVDPDAGTITLDVRLSAGGMETLLDLFDLSGVLTVSDVLSASERSALLNLTEEENPAVIAALEQFLSTDFLQYAADPDRQEARLVQSVSGDRFESEFDDLLAASRLRAFARTADVLTSAHTSLWPLPLFTVERVDWENDSVEHLSLEIRVHAKSDVPAPAAWGVES